MPDFCAAYGCTNERNLQTRSKGITFHRFPKENRKEWEVLVRRKDFVATERSLLCSDHFKEEDFDRTGQITRLRQGAKPSVFNFPPHLRKQLEAKAKLLVIKVEDKPPMEQPVPCPKVEPKTAADHSYALPDSLSALKTRLCGALARVESLERKERNSMIRERRAKRYVHILLEDLRQLSLINKELKDRLDLYSTYFPDVPEKPPEKRSRKRRSVIVQPSPAETVS